jgi:hypothetical protein
VIILPDMIVNYCIMLNISLKVIRVKLSEIFRLSVSTTMKTR